ncbi:Bug family tripartite tricarboxylate transporter substrate binding protein [Cupriavidus necator]|uniref:Bug family tripartite tricarboxylate transporter substrate binding protein n=1 Tax=Cupriavidus necator TaxID=106590 RepID=UPI0007359A06|nr:tripartite tricarboxylate transporter substrate binding protein [Cupriavidus necator]KUE86000.1 hypothetical protein ASL20_25925 [Cupriavidus necator]
MTLTRRAFCALTALGLAFSNLAIAAEWPAKQPIRIIVPYPAGGNADSAARALAEAIGGNLKQTVIVDNRPGASSIIGTDVVARAPADGYTIGVVSDSHAINHAMARLPKAADILGAKVPYDAVRDFVPVSGMIQIPLVLVVNPKVSARTVKEVVQLSKDKKGSGLNFGTMGTGSPWFIHMHQLSEATGGVFVNVPYKGLAPAATDLIGGQTDIMVMPVHYAQQYIRTGKLVPIATLSAQRHPLLPDVPTLAESGYPGLSISNYLFFVAPAGTPQPVVDRLAKELNAALKTPAIKAKLATSGDPYPAEPAELAARLRRDIETYGRVIQSTIK